MACSCLLASAPPQIILHTAVQRNLLEPDTSTLLFKHIPSPLALTRLSPASAEALNGLTCPRLASPQTHRPPLATCYSHKALAQLLSVPSLSFPLPLLPPLSPQSGLVLEYLGQRKTQVSLPIGRKWGPKRRKKELDGSSGGGD